MNPPWKIMIIAGCYCCDCCFWFSSSSSLVGGRGGRTAVAEQEKEAEADRGHSLLLAVLLLRQEDHLDSTKQIDFLSNYFLRWVVENCFTSISCSTPSAGEEEEVEVSNVRISFPSSANTQQQQLIERCCLIFLSIKSIKLSQGIHNQMKMNEQEKNSSIWLIERIMCTMVSLSIHYYCCGFEKDGNWKLSMRIEKEWKYSFGHSFRS